MRILSSTGRDDLAMAYVAESADGRLVEFTEALQPPLSRDDKWVLVVSSLFGCPVRCAICDAGGNYAGVMSLDDILAQIDFLVDRRYPGRRVPSRKFKIQFARVGEPTLNPAVLEALEALPVRYDAPGLMPALSTIAPRGCDRFMERLLSLKRRTYGERFQLQFSIHTTDRTLRDKLIPAPKWDFHQIAEYGPRFRGSRGRKITLNFALARGAPIDAEILLRHFDPAHFLIKITPVNPTHQAVRNAIVSRMSPGGDEARSALERLKGAGYDVLLSVGELEENRIGSNCGQFIQRHWELAEGPRDLALGDGYVCVDEAGPAPAAGVPCNSRRRDGRGECGRPPGVD